MFHMILSELTGSTSLSHCFSSFLKFLTGTFAATPCCGLFMVPRRTGWATLHPPTNSCCWSCDSFSLRAADSQTFGSDVDWHAPHAYSDSGPSEGVVKCTNSVRVSWPFWWRDSLTLMSSITAGHEITPQLPASVAPSPYKDVSIHVTAQLLLVRLHCSWISSSETANCTYLNHGCVLQEKE